nr:MAG TPA: hypothetical protein [Caudoviricetes sp.]
MQRGMKMKLVEKIRSAPLPVKYTVLVTYTRIFQVMLKTMSQDEAMYELHKALYTEVPDK